MILVECICFAVNILIFREIDRMTTNKKSLTIRKDIQVIPKSPNHRVQQLSRNKSKNKSQSKNKTKSRVKDIVISKETAKRFNHLMAKHTVTVHISP
jgi:hypothetical protein